MENLEQLRLKENFLKIELKALQEKIALLSDEAITMVIDEPEKKTSSNHSTNQVQTVPRSEKSIPLTADVLLKNMYKDKLSPDPLSGKFSALVIDEPLVSSPKSSTSPVANGSGKDSTNPLIPVALGKSKDAIKPPNVFLQEFVPSYLKVAEKSAEICYVIYSGPHKGIHTDWPTTKAFCETDNVKSKRFTSFASAKLSLRLYEQKTVQEKHPLLRPKVARIEKKKDFIVQEENVPEKEEVIPLREFLTLWSKARAADAEELLHEKFYTDDKPSRSLFNFIEGADPELVKNSFNAGLIKMIYPSSNLQELRHLPNGIFEAIKYFRKKISKAKDSPMFLKITSSIPDWSNEGSFGPYHFIEIGLAKDKRNFSQSIVMEEQTPSLEELTKLRIQGLKIITEKIISIKENANLKVNYSCDNCLITSWCPNQLSPDEVRKIGNFEKKFYLNTLDICIGTKRKWCIIAQKIFLEHLCTVCQDETQGQEKDSPAVPPYAFEEKSTSGE